MAKETLVPTQPVRSSEEVTERTFNKLQQRPDMSVSRQEVESTVNTLWENAKIRQFVGALAENELLKSEG